MKISRIRVLHYTESKKIHGLSRTYGTHAGEAHVTDDLTNTKVLVYERGYL